MPPLLKYIAWALALAEVAAILVARNPSTMPSEPTQWLYALKHTSSTPKVAISPAFMFGWAMVVLGALIRDACYRHLGRQFTFQLAIIEDHKLITQGPYSVVRHPSYTGWLMHTVGLLIIQTCGGSWIAECGILNIPVGRTVVAAYVLFLLYVDGLTVDRTWREDEALRKQFGEQWVQWSKQTPYRLFPGVF
ncbi:hypothetical protein PYCCODRAFT_1440397 [Trametes coccinea BRFM310]|uniref:Protein-S-isoprenylcysteine O-methyltransferase n=1 Tax=Trametes coccinea (strain BRFM310) TaxID=1353009 RepID=A0A1Y2I7U7_TRAC3|nr:hypothetical protein PYCCODRAFT_1440397 [Trametes coccinea BRFM310]